MKILHIGNTGGVSTTLRNRDRSRGDASMVIITYKHPFKYDIDEFISITGKNLSSLLNCVKLYSKAIYYDRIHYHTTPVVSGLDMLVLKYLLRKKIYIHYHGTEIRGKKQPFIHKLIADRTFVSTPDLLKDVPDAEWLPNLVIEEEIPFEIRKQYLRSKQVTGPIVILHTPTDRELKGTIYVEEAINKLKQNGYNIDYREISGKSHSEILKEMAKCDVYVDQLILGWYGVSSIECALMEIPSICFIEEELEKRYHPPFIQSPKDQIYDVLKSVCDSPLETLRIIGQNEKQYYLKIHKSMVETLYH